MSVFHQLGDLMVVMVIIGMGLYGWQHGVFLATLAAMQVFIAAMAALGFAGLVEPLLAQAECPEAIAFAVAFLIVLAAVLVLTRLAIGAGVAEDAMRLPPIIDRTVGPVVGLFAGALLAGTILIAWSMAPLPESFRIDGPKLGLDVGSPLLRTAARCFEQDGLEERLLAAYATNDWTPGAVAPPPAAALGDVTPSPAPQPGGSSAADGP